MVNYFDDRFQQKYKLSILRSKFEKAKKVLSTVINASINCNSFYEVHDFSDYISRAMFESVKKLFFCD